MTNEKLNILMLEHVRLKSEVTFNALYFAAKEALYKMHVAVVCNNRYCKEDEALETFDNAFMEISDKLTEGDDFLRLLSKALKNDRLNLFSRTKTYRNRFEFTIDTEDSAPTLSVTDKTLEDTFFTKIREGDQRQLIAHLIDPDKVDSTTLLIANAYLDDKEINLSELQIAKSVGLHHQTAKRKLHKLSRRFDANRFGDICDYVAV